MIRHISKFFSSLADYILSAFEYSVEKPERKRKSARRMTELDHDKVNDAIAKRKRKNAKRAAAAASVRKEDV